MAFKKKEEVQKIRVSNTDIVIGHRYEIVHKIDRDAPTPKNGEPTVKLPTPNNGETHSIVFDDEMRRWDTGFEIESACNRVMGTAGKDAVIQEYVKLIQKPYEDFYRADTNAMNNDFWDTYYYEIYPGKVFNTSKPNELFDLFHALKQGKVCNIGEKDASLQRSAVYCIQNIVDSKSAEDKKLLNKYDVIVTFDTMLGASDLSETAEIFTYLEYAGFINLRGVDKDSIKKQVLRAFEDEKNGALNISRFNEAIEMSKDKSRKLELELFSILTVLRAKNKLKFERQQFHLRGEILGNSLKDAAKVAINNPEKKEAILQEWEEIQK